MPGCNCGSNVKFDGLSETYKRILWIVIALNVLMFAVEMSASVIADSMALRADALDFLGDSLTYSITLLAIGHSIRWRASAALFKGITLALIGLWVLGSSLYRTLILGMPNEAVMTTVAIMAFAANMASVLLLIRYRDGDANIRSVWLCSRNDAIGNLAVLAAAGAVFYFQSPWPDLLVALLMASLFLHSATLILRQAKSELNQASNCSVEPIISIQK